jgi:hypothetical protein
MTQFYQKSQGLLLQNKHETYLFKPTYQRNDRVKTFETLKMTESKNVDQLIKFLEVYKINLKWLLQPSLNWRMCQIFQKDELMGSLFTHETRLHIEDESISNAFKNQLSFSGGRGRGIGKGRGHRGRGIIPCNNHSCEGHRQ